MKQSAYIVVRSDLWPHVAIFHIVFVCCFFSLTKGYVAKPENFPSSGATRQLLQTTDIRGGVPALQGRFPYMCLVKRSGTFKFMCGATLIHENWILTAAHCVDPNREGASGTDAIIVCGLTDRHANNQENVYFMRKTIVHYLWDGTTVHGHDVALVKLDRVSDLERPRILNHESDLIDKVFTALGWGKSNTFGVYHDNLHMVTTLDHVSLQSCNSTRLWNGLIKSGMFCAGLGKGDTCLGDSGGPILLPDPAYAKISDGDAKYDILVGIISFGKDPCGQVGFPGVYTSIAFYREWIDEVIKNNV